MFKCDCIFSLTPAKHKRNEKYELLILSLQLRILFFFFLKTKDKYFTFGHSFFRPFCPSITWLYFAGKSFVISTLRWLMSTNRSYSKLLLNLFITYLWINMEKSRREVGKSIYRYQDDCRILRSPGLINDDGQSPPTPISHTNRLYMTSSKVTAHAIHTKSMYMISPLIFDFGYRIETDYIRWVCF